MKVRWNVETGYVMNTPGWELEIPDEDLEGLSENERNNAIDDYVYEAMLNTITNYWKEVG